MDFIVVHQMNMKVYHPSKLILQSEEDSMSKTDLLKAPTVEDLKSIIQMNLINDNKITLEYVNLAEKRYGPGIGLIKGKTTRSKILSKETNQINIPKELIDKNHYTV